MAVFELRLPSPTVLTLIVRDGATFVPQHETLLRNGDREHERCEVPDVPRTQQASSSKVRDRGCYMDRVARSRSRRAMTGPAVIPCSTTEASTVKVTTAHSSRSGTAKPCWPKA